MSGFPTPHRLWFTPVPSTEKPLDGGALLHIQPAEDDDVLTVGLDLVRILSLQVAVSRLAQIVVRASLSGAPGPKPITEDEISSFLAELDQQEKEEPNE